MAPRIINTTPHEVSVFNPITKHSVTFPADKKYSIRGGYIPDPKQSDVGGIEVFENGEYTQEAIPFELRDGDILIVSMVTGNCVEEMTEAEFEKVFQGKKVRVVSPGSGPLNSKRDAGGKILESLQFVEYFPKGKGTGKKRASSSSDEEEEGQRKKMEKN